MQVRYPVAQRTRGKARHITKPKYVVYAGTNVAFFWNRRPICMYPLLRHCNTSQIPKKTMARPNAGTYVAFSRNLRPEHNPPKNTRGRVACHVIAGKRGVPTKIFMRFHKKTTARPIAGTKYVAFCWNRRATAVGRRVVERQTVEGAPQISQLPRKRALQVRETFRPHTNTPGTSYSFFVVKGAHAIGELLYTVPK